MVGSPHRSEQRDDNHQPNDTMNQRQVTIHTAAESLITVLSWQPWETAESAIAALSNQTGLEILRWEFN
jgi:hypothetical protein